MDMDGGRGMSVWVVLEGRGVWCVFKEQSRLRRNRAGELWHLLTMTARLVGTAFELDRLGRL